MNALTPIAQTPVAASLAAVAVLRKELRQALDAHTLAEDRVYELQAELDKEHCFPPLPDVLTVQTPAMTLSCEGRSAEVPAWTKRFTRIEEIEAEPSLSEERKAQMLRALKEWNAAKDAVRSARGLTAAEVAERRAERAADAVDSRLARAIIAALLAPAANDKERKSQAALLNDDTLTEEQIVRVAKALIRRPPSLPPVDGTCSAAAIALELDASIARQRQAEQSEYSASRAGDYGAAAAAAALARHLDDEHWLITDRLAAVQATSAKGAAAQIAVAMGYADLVRGVKDQAERDEHHTTVERLLESAAAFMAAHISEPVWQWYVGAVHPGPATPAADADLQFVIWQKEFDRLLAASGRDREDQETGPNWKAAIQLDDLIRRTPGASPSAAAVKLRQLLHPELGLIAAGEASSDEDALRTALAALEGKPPKAKAGDVHVPSTAVDEDTVGAAHLIAAE